MNLLDLARSALPETPAPANNSPARQWRVRYRSGAAMTVLFTPPATAAEVADAYPGATIEPLADDGASQTAPANPAADRRRARALAILAERAEQRIAVVAEPGDPAHVAIAIRGADVGELEIPAERYDAFELLALMQHYGNA